MSEFEAPEQSYFPSCKVRLTVRFEEFAAKTGGALKEPRKLLTKLKGIKDPKSGVTANEVTTGNVTRWYLDPDSGSVNADESADKYTQTVGGIIPSRCQVNLNGLRTADTASFEFRFVDLPLDPRIIRSVGVEIFMGTVSASDFQAGLLGAKRGGSNDSTGEGDPLNLIPDTWVDDRGNTRSNLRFQGFADEYEIEYMADREPVVRLKCRDLTALVIDTNAPPGLVLDVSAPIDKAIATYLSNFPSFAGFSVEYRGANTPPMLKGQLSKTAYSAKTGGPAPSKGGGAGSKLSVWDYLTDLVGIIGHTIRIEGSRVIVEHVHSILGEKQRDDDPFVGIRKIIYGRNVSSMKLARKFGKTAPKNIEVHCWSNRLKTTLVERFPMTSDPLVTKSGDENETVYQVIRIEGIEDRGTLKLIAQSTFEQIGRNEMGVSIRTKNLASFGYGNADVDLLDLKAGDSLDVQINRDLTSSTVCGVDQIFASQAMAGDFLRVCGFSAAFADVAAEATANAGFGTTFKTKNVTFAWQTGDGDDCGISIDINAVNFTQVRVDPIFKKDPVKIGEVEITSDAA